MGSGYVINSLFHDVLSNDCVGVGVDINHDALRASESAVKGKTVDLLQGSLMSSIAKRPIFDIIFCNPPYVPSVSLEEYKKKCEVIDLSWAGGINGRQIIDSYITMGSDLLSDTGVMYLLVVQRNDPDSMIEMARELGLQCTVKFKDHNCRMFSQGEMSPNANMYLDLRSEVKCINLENLAGI